MDVAMNDIQIERSLKAIISKKEKEQIKQTRRLLEETRISLLSLLEAEKLALQNNHTT
jgi:hypothetical protein